MAGPLAGLSEGPMTESATADSSTSAASGSSAEASAGQQSIMQRHKQPGQSDEKPLLDPSRPAAGIEADNEMQKTFADMRRSTVNHVTA